MRIIIEIEGEDVTVRTEREEKPGSMYIAETPPPALLRAAMARGAASAGPAPREAELAEPSAELSAAAVEALAEPVDAGAGPFPPPGIPGGEGEERTGEIDEQRS
jgi:hypothetical protein